MKENCNLHVNHKALGGVFENTVEPMINIGSSNIRKTKYASESCNTLVYIWEVIRGSLETKFWKILICQCILGDMTHRPYKSF